jgi:hypothetical protein
MPASASIRFKSPSNEAEADRRGNAALATTRSPSVNTASGDAPTVSSSNSLSVFEAVMLRLSISSTLLASIWEQHNSRDRFASAVR